MHGASAAADTTGSASGSSGAENPAVIDHRPRNRQ